MADSCACPVVWCAAVQVVSFAPFAILSTLCYAWVVFGMANLRPGFGHAAALWLMMVLGYLIGCQVSRTGDNHCLRPLRLQVMGGGCCVGCLQSFFSVHREAVAVPLASPLHDAVVKYETSHAA
jgi:hypothetical protein